ncbi:phosphatidylglycerophosphatase A family protein [Geotalea toluenoxydans]|uniref:phosphatidylglycerophosphatase A family protein n=1 Tax=Geotalea toluenoxydans TaxID=421624 RepID=UPI0006D1E726|nr:phosphatidylglycerophosphatase A [Geotalea toluenoxydans]
MRRFVILSATWFGAGFSPVASGTVGTLAAIPLYLVLARLSLPLYLLTLLGFFFYACWASDRAEFIFGEKDSGKIVIDEVIGFLITMTGVPCSWQGIVAGFFLFRFFDITKIPPARFFDRRVKNGYGVVLDDVVAGIYAAIVLHLLLRFM